MYRAFMRTMDAITATLPIPKTTIRPTVGDKSASCHVRRQPSTSSQMRSTYFFCDCLLEALSMKEEVEPK